MPRRRRGRRLPRGSASPELVANKEFFDKLVEKTESRKKFKKQSIASKAKSRRAEYYAGLTKEEKLKLDKVMKKNTKMSTFAKAKKRKAEKKVRDDKKWNDSGKIMAILEDDEL